jgi:hypothetical protein
VRSLLARVRGSCIDSGVRRSAGAQSTLDSQQTRRRRTAQALRTKTLKVESVCVQFHAAHSHDQPLLGLIPLGIDEVANRKAESGAVGLHLVAGLYA